jgi:tetratricopeptide (TPR) repeat protein
VREFIVDELLTDSGARDDIDRERANAVLARKGVPAGAIDELVRRRLLHIDERGGRPRVELIHDVLLDFVREDKTKREAIRDSEANLQREREAAQRDREKARRRLQIVTVAAVAVVTIGFIGYLYEATREQRALANQNFQLAVTSAQRLLSQVGDSLNHGFITVKGANDMLQVARGIVEQVRDVERTPQTTELLVKLGWTASDIYATLGDLTQAYDRAKGARDLAEPLFKADPNDPSLIALMYGSIWRMADAIASRDVERATHEQALKLYREAEELARRAVQLAPQDGTRQRNLVFVLQKVGDVYQVLKDWDDAIRTYREALPIMQAVAAKEPRNRDWQRDLANTVSRLGQALAGKGDLDAALEQSLAALKIRSDLLATDRLDAVLQSNVAISHREIARLYERRRELDAALTEYRLAIGILEQLLDKDPGNANWQTALAPLYAGAAGVLKRKGDLTGALEQYRKAYAVRHELAVKDSTNPARQHSFATAGMAVADLLVEQNQDLDQAVSIYRTAIDSIDDFRPRYDGDIFRCYIKIGNILKLRNDPEGALAEYKKASAIAQEAATNDPTSAAWRNNLRDSYTKIGDLLIAEGRTAEALDYYKKALEVVRLLMAKHPDSAEWAALVQLLQTQIERLTPKL